MHNRMIRVTTGGALAALILLGACGKSEEEVRREVKAEMADEKIRNLESELAEQKAALAEKEVAASTAQPAETTPVAGVAPAPAASPAPVAPAAKSSVVAAPGAQLLESYTATIGQDDLYNSSGARVTDPAAILRQDRANVHKFGVSQPGDSMDGFFASTANRGRMETMLRSGSITPQAAAALRSGNARVTVQIYGRGGRGEYLKVVVQ